MPTDRAAQSAIHTLSVEEIQILQAMSYERYLRTPHWFRVRNRALKLARFKCQRCAVNRELQVHHLSYERLGEEADEDLQVLCRGCHLGHHVDEIQNRLGLGVYLKIISEALKAERFTVLADLVEEVKCRCARARISYDGGQIHRALDRLDQDKRLTFQFQSPHHAELFDVGRDQQPLTRAEAAGWMAKLGAIVKSIPNVPRLSRHHAAAHRASEIVAREIMASIQRCEDAERLAAETANTSGVA